MDGARWVLLLVLVAAIWGSTFALVKDTLFSLGTFTLLALRFLLSTLLLAAYVFLSKKPFTLRELRAGAAIGFFLFIGYAAQTFGLNFTSATASAFITGFLVIFTPVFSALLLRKFPEAKIWPAAALAVIGLFLLTGASLGGIGIGEFATLVCAAGFALEIIWIEKHKRSGSLPGILLSMCATVALLSLILMLPLEGIPSAISLQSLAAIAFLALFGTVLAQAGQVVAQRHIAPSQTAIILLAEPIFAAIFGIILLGESLTLQGASGAALMLAGMFLAEYDFTKKSGQR